MNKVILRAITAYSRTDLKTTEDASVRVKGRETTWLGKDYVVLEDEASHKHVAVYRCMNRGELKRLKRWPPGVTEQVQSKDLKKTPAPASVPAILELSPIKDASKPKTRAAVQKSAKGKASDPSASQTDLFE